MVHKICKYNILSSILCLTLEFGKYDCTTIRNSAILSVTVHPELPDSLQVTVVLYGHWATWTSPREYMGGLNPL
jgi:hypothetical protein